MSNVKLCERGNQLDGHGVAIMKHNLWENLARLGIS